MIILEILAGWLLADLFSGIFHAAGDSEIIGNTKLMKWISKGNINHHDNPYAIVHEGYVSRNRSSWIGTAIIGTIWFLIFGMSAMLITMILGGFIVSEVHRWSHAPSRAPKIVKMLQRTGIFLSPKYHALHHRPPHSWRFCVLTNYINPILDLIPRKKHE